MSELSTLLESSYYSSKDAIHDIYSKVSVGTLDVSQRKLLVRAS